MSEVRLSRLGQVALSVGDIHDATAFYRDVLGLRHLFDAPPDLSFFECDGVRIMLNGGQETAGVSSTIVYFEVGDVQAAHAALTERGATFERGPQLMHKTDTSELWMAFVRDPAGNILGLMGEKPVS